MVRRLATIWGLTLALGGILFAGQHARAQEADQPKTLRVYAWANYIDEVLLRKFETEYKVRAELATYTSNEELTATLLKLREAGEPTYDIVIPSDYAIADLRARGLLARLGKARLPNLKRVDDFFMEKYFDPANEFSVPFLWGTAGIGYQSKQVTPEPTSWEDLWRVEHRGKVTMLDDPREALAVALIRLGFNVNTSSPEEIEAAKNLLIEQGPIVAGYESDTTKVIGAGEVTLTHSWSGAVVRSQRDYPEWKYMVPREGATFFIDNLAIPADAPNKALAEDFINWVIEAKTIATVTEFTRYANCVTQSRRYIQSGLAQDPYIYPSKLLLSKLQMLRLVPEANLPAPEMVGGMEVRTLFEKAWAEVKARKR